MNILITGALSNSKNIFEKIKELGHNIIYIQDETISLDKQNIDYKWIEGVVCNGLFMYNDIRKFINLKYIQLISAGYDRVPIEYIKSHNITLHNARGVYSIPMAEYAICGVLEILKGVKFFIENQKKHAWIKNRKICELNAKEVLIVGCGSVGQECAKRFKAFGCAVYGVDLYPAANENFIKQYAIEHLDLLLSTADIVVLTLPLTAETNRMFDEEKLKNFKQGSILVNIARGKIVDNEALITALENQLGGAVLDVFEEEPLSNESQLWDMDNVIITPHNSFVSSENSTRMNNLIIRNLCK